MSNKHDDWFKKSSKKSDAPKLPHEVEEKSQLNNDEPLQSQSLVLEQTVEQTSVEVKDKEEQNVVQTATTFDLTKIGRSKLTTRSSSSKFGRYYQKFVQTVANHQLLTKILYTLLMILIFRIASSITAPGISISKEFTDNASNSASFLGVMDLIGGGALRNFSIVALGISPYITASIIVQLLTSEVFPPLNRLSKSGPQGKRKINILSRWLTLMFAILQAITMIQQLTSGGITIAPELNTTIYKFVVIPLILVAGSFFTLFLGEQITNRGVGNGTSLIIFSGIAVALPSQFRNAYTELVEGNQGNSTFIGALNFIVYIIAFLVLCYIVGFFYLAERRVPIQQTGAGLVKDHKEISHLPIKINPAGVMPVVFSLALTALPITIVQFFHHQNLGRQWVEENLKLTASIGLSIFVVLTFFFTIVMSLVTFNTYTIADNFKKNGTFIPGVQPGRQTEQYLTGIVLRLSIFSAFYLSAISAIQYVEQIAGLSNAIAFGGTSLIILVTVAIETISQLKARDKTVKIAKARKMAINRTSGEKDKNVGLLW